MSYLCCHHHNTIFRQKQSTHIYIMSNNYLRRKLRWILFLCLAIFSSTAMFAQNVTALTDGSYYRIKTGNTDGTAQKQGFIADSDGQLQTQALNTTNGDAQVWKVTKVTDKTDFYVIQNKKTLRYLQPTSVNNQAIKTAESETQVYVPANTNTGSELTWFNIMADANASYSYNWRGDNTVQGWEPNDGKSNNLSGSEWAFIEADYYDKLREPGQTAAGQVKPVCGTNIYQIFNYSSTFSDNRLNENDGNKLGSVTSTSTSNLQYWQLIEQSDGTVAIQNLITGHYVQSLNGMNAGSNYSTGTDAYGFTIAINEKILTNYAYDIRDNATHGFNCTDRAGGAICNWTFFDGTKDYNSLWVFKKVEFTDDEVASMRTEYNKSLQFAAILSHAKVRIKSRRGTSETWNVGGASSTVDCSNRYVTDMTDAVTDGNGTSRMETLKTGDDAKRQVWVILPKGSGYTFRNLYTGKYLNYGNTGEARTFYIRYNPDNTSEESYVNIANDANFSGAGLHYQTTYHKIVSWDVNASDYRGCDWLFEQVDDITDDDVRAAFDGFDNRLTSIPTDQWIVIRDIYGNVMSENTANNEGDAVGQNKTKYNQYWKLIAVDGKEGYYQIQNALTQHYMNPAGFNARCSGSESEADGGFKIGRVTSYSRFGTYFDMQLSTNNGYALHSSNNRVLVWNSYASDGAAASVWSFESANITDEDLIAARQDLATNKEEKANASTYAANITQFFDNEACTQLKDAYKAMTDEELTTALTAASITSSALQTMVLKIKNDSWAKWEKIFRVRDIEPYTNPDTWNDLLKIGNVYTRLDNPTGIWAEQSGLIYIFVGADIPDGCSIQARLVSASDSQGSAIALTKGLNIISSDDEAAVYIHYEVPTTTADDSKKWRDFANIPVHIEGGTIDGYFDATREGINTDAAWKEMVADGLFSKKFVMMKGTNVIYQMETTATKKQIPEKMREIVDFWDWMVGVQHSLMAVDEYKDRWRNVLGFYSCTYNYMFATNYGTYYNFNDTDVQGILNYDNMASGGGSLWGPAHEVGHNHQLLINMIGCTEISNNLFAQAVVHQNGKTSTRLNGRKFKDVADNFAAHKSWHDYDLWDRNTLYLKLYLYYEVEGFHPGLFCELFRSFRKDPMNRSTGSTSNPTPASEDFLKFATRVCEITGDDLSEFFQAYGFGVTFDTRKIGDYSDFYTNCTQEMVDEAFNKMHQYSKPKGNILFIENHIKHEPQQDHDGNLLYDENGNVLLRADFNETDAVGKCGDVGSYSDFATGHYASGYTYSQTDNTITMEGEGAVGYKVYDNDGNLLYFANTNTFTLPESVVNALAADGKSMVIKAAQPDGSDITLPAAGSETFAVKVYHTDALSTDKAQTVYTDGTESTIPTLTDNAIGIIQPSETNAAIPTLLLQTTNMVNGEDNTAYHVVLTDKKDFFAPSDFTATTLEYSRTNTAGYNSVCLPFAFSATDFGEGCQVEQFSSIQEGDATTITFRTTEGENAAGVPCLVYCPEDITEWNVTKTDAQVVASPVASGLLQGSFTNETIGEGKYKLNSTGTKFGVTTSKGTVAAFRTYLSPTDGQSMARTLSVVHESIPVTSIRQTHEAAAPQVIYDLSGRQVTSPSRAGIYIMNGKKVVKQ